MFEIFIGKQDFIIYLQKIMYR